MSKSQNISMGNRRRNGNTTPQKVNNHTVEDLVDSDGDEISVSEVKRMLKSLKRTYKNNSINSKRIWTKKI
jgi:hypothetical protein